MIKAVRGTRDLLPPDTALWNFVEDTVRDVFRAYNFHEIRTPIFESTELFARGVGEETDIVSKEMFTWEDRFRASVGGGSDTGNVFGTGYGGGSADGAGLGDGSGYGGGSGAGTGLSDGSGKGERRGQMLTLRPENTAGIVRAYIEHKIWDRGLNKFFAIGPMFRRERPQKGRYRQFFQIDAEIIGPKTAGSESPARDAEILELLATLLDRVGIKDWTLELNSVGCPNDRAQFNEALRKALEPVVGQMCADCQRRAVTNPLRVFDCKVPEDQPIIETLPRISQFLDEGCRTHFEQVKEILNAVGVLTRSTTAWCAASTTTRAPRSSSRTARLARRTQSLAAAATTDSPKLSAVRNQHLASASPSARTVWCYR